MFDTTSKWLHWLVAALYIAIIPTGLMFDSLVPGSPEKLRMIDIHETAGLALLVLAAWRLARRLRDGLPAENRTHRGYERLVARVVQIVLLVATVALPLSGIYAAWELGDPLTWFGLTIWPAEVPRGGGTLSFVLHGGPLIVLGLTPFLLLHIAGALKHHWIDRDDTLRRMWFSR